MTGNDIKRPTFDPAIFKIERGIADNWQSELSNLANKRREKRKALGLPSYTYITPETPKAKLSNIIKCAFVMLTMPEMLKISHDLRERGKVDPEAVTNDDEIGQIGMIKGWFQLRFEVDEENTYAYINARRLFFQLERQRIALDDFEAMARFVMEGPFNDEVENDLGSPLNAIVWVEWKADKS